MVALGVRTDVGWLIASASRRGRSTPARPALTRRGAVLVALIATLLLAAPAGVAAQTPPTSTPVTSSSTSAPTTSTTRPTTVPSSSSTTTTEVPPDSSTTSSSALTGPPGTDVTADATTTTVPGDPFAGIGEIPPEELELINRYRDILSRSSDLTTQLEILSGGIAASQRDLDDAQHDVDDAERRLHDTEDELDRTEQELEHARDRLRERAVAVYIGGNLSLGRDTAMLQAASVDDLGKSRAYGDAVVDDERTIVREAEQLHQKVDDLHRRAEQDREAATKARDDLTGRQKDLTDRRDAIVAAEGDLAKASMEKIALLSEAAQQKLSVEQGFARVQAVRDSISNTRALRQDGQTPPATTLGIFLSPLPHPKINQPFGASVDPLFGVVRGHPGIDINGKTGDPIRAPADGVVAAAGWIDGYGNCTILDHGSALGTLYGHQSLIAVKEGDVVKRGQVIGFVGSTGYSTGPHLHWEVRVLGQVVDPAPFIGDQN